MMGEDMEEKSAKIGILLLVAIGLAGCVTGPEQRGGSSALSTKEANRRRGLPIPIEMRQQVRNSEIIGRQIYILDKVSAIATDVLSEKVPSYREKNLAGYLPFREGGDDLRPKDSYLVTFFTKEEPMRIAYEVRMKPDAAPELAAFDPPIRAPGSFVHMAKARQAAIAALPSYPQPINPLILPAELLGEKGMMVYLIAGTTKPNVAVFGRHYRVLIPERGGPPSYVMPLSKTILELPTKAPDGANIEALLVTHLLTDWPLETHVFVSLLTHKRVYVGTRIGIWSVDGDKITFIGDRPQDGKN
jgi:hypothetical protein